MKFVYEVVKLMKFYTLTFFLQLTGLLMQIDVQLMISFPMFQTNELT